MKKTIVKIIFILIYMQNGINRSFVIRNNSFESINTIQAIDRLVKVNGEKEIMEVKKGNKNKSKSKNF